MLNESNIQLEEDGIEEEILVDEEVAITKAMWGDVGGNIENQTDLQNALDAKQDSLTEAQLNAVNSGITAGKVATYDGYADQIARKADQSALNAETIARGEADTALGTRIDNEALARQSADNGLQTQIDAITSKSDVVDVVANYAALQAYDTSTLGNNDVVKVLDDETHEDALTYYRWSTTTQTWSYIGQEAPYYSKGQMDVMLQGKQDTLTAGANIQISNDVISATDTTYTAGNGINLNGTEFSADTDVLATKEDLENHYTKTEADNLLAPKLEAEVVAELPTTGEEGKLYLTPKARTTQTATGNPITATITDGAGSMESFQLDGDTFQNGTPTPEEPVPIQTVTGEQTVEIVGKNLIDPDGLELGNIDASGNDSVSQQVVRSGYIRVAAGSYTLKVNNSDNNINLWRYAIYDNNKTFVSADTPQTKSAAITITNNGYIRVSFYNVPWKNLTVQEIIDSQVQLELGSTATAYAPYHATSYPISLGSIELCKLGTYQDYIWKDGEDWKVHKATSKVSLDGSESWSRWITPDENTIETRTFTLKKSFFGELVPYFSPYAGIVNTAKSDRFTVRNTVWDNVILTCCALNGDDTRCLQVKLEKTYLEYSDSMTTAELEALFKAWLVNKPTTLYYALATATDTTITDQTLIAQLEAIRTAMLENGTNTITNTATGSNLAGDMEISYYEYDPTNRYDKWLWLRANNAYEEFDEEGGGGGGSYSAGYGINIDANNEISADQTVLALRTDLVGKQDVLTAGSNITISNNTISATDTTYSAMTGATSSAAGTSGLVPAPAAGDDTKFLKGDGTWGTASGSGPTVVQTTGQSTTDVMSQKAVTDIIGNIETILQTLNSGGGAQ